MNGYKVTVQIEKLEEGGYLAVVPEIQGCHAEGETITEAIENAQDVARVILELIREKGLPMPLLDYVEEESVTLRAELLVPAA
ncbi:MAG: type II toxin-antitoxin system HicB family antitoxin [Anaerolineae bacterium]